MEGKFAMLLGAALAAVTPSMAQAQTHAEDREPSVAIVPSAFIKNAMLTTGCWARLYRGSNFTGEGITMAGPVDLPKSELPPAFRWGGSFDSLQVGPKATLTTFDNEDYTARSAVFEPGAQVPDLDEKLGQLEKIRSLRITCRV
jgi:hypothetical protein